MRFSLYIAKRYLFSKSDNNAINIISIIAALGVIAATFALFVVLSVFSGLKDFSLSFTNAYDPDLKVLPAEGKKITLNDQQYHEVLEISGVKKASQVIEEKVLLQFKDKSSPAIFKAVDSNFLKTNQLNKQLVYGEWYGEGLYQVVMGSRLQRDLSVGIRDYSGLLNIYVPKPGKGQILDISNAFEKASTSVVGVFSVNEELDQNYVIGDINIARELLTFKDHHISAIELKLDEKADIEAITASLNEIIKEDIIVKDRIALNDSLYKMLNTENLAVYLIFTLVLIIALFNVIGSITMAILDKRHDLKLLKNIGATKNQIVSIFFLQGSLMSILGGFIGLILGFILVLLQLKFSFIMFTERLPYPVKIEWQNFVLVIVTITVLGALASRIAAARVKKLL